jgi:hypothetical protein
MERDFFPLFFFPPQKININQKWQLYNLFFKKKVLDEKKLRRRLQLIKVLHFFLTAQVGLLQRATVIIIIICLVATVWNGKKKEKVVKGPMRLRSSRGHPLPVATMMIWPTYALKFTIYYSPCIERAVAVWFIVFHDVVKEDNLAAVKVVVDESPFFLFFLVLFLFFFVLRARRGDHRRAEEEEEEEEMTFTLVDRDVISPACSSCS